MLPTEAFAEAVTFLPLFDLNALVVTNAMCSSLAVNASNRICWEEFPGLQFYISDRWIQITKFIDFGPPDDDFDSCPKQLVASLTFSNENVMAEFVAVAFPNCIFEYLVISRFLSKLLMDAIERVAVSVIVKGALQLHGSMSPDDSIMLIQKFRNVKALHLYFCRKVSKDGINEIANMCRRSGIKDLWYNT